MPFARSHSDQRSPAISKSVKPVPGRDHLFGTSRTKVTASGRPVGILNNTSHKRLLERTVEQIDGKRIAPWKIHWLRHSFITHMKHTLKINAYMVESIVQHLTKSQFVAMAEVYTHGRPDGYEIAQRTALESWAQLLRDAADKVERKTATNVTPLFASGETA